MQERGASDSLSFFLLLAGYLLLAIATLLILRVAVFDYWLGTASPPGILLLGLPVIPLVMVIAGHAMRRNRSSEKSARSGQ
jgi:O-antigen/teichoic acid export membrane protein